METTANMASVGGSTLEPLEPRALKPRALEPVAGEPLGVEPRALKPRALEPVAGEPLGVEPRGLAPRALEPTGRNRLDVEPAGLEPRALERPPRLATAMLTLRTGVALVLACLRYALDLSLHVRAQTRHWRRQAWSIEDPQLRVLALRKLSEERFNAEAASIAATLCPAAQRRQVARAIVALEVMFDYLDGLGERPLSDPIGDGMALYEPFMRLFEAPWRNPAATVGNPNRADVNTADVAMDGGRRYLEMLAGAVREALADLPAGETVAKAGSRYALAGAEAQVRMHAVHALGEGQLCDWATARFAQDAPVGWREQLAGAACSVLTLHALIVAASDPRMSAAEADRLCAAYLPLCALMTLLDGLVDREHDADAGRLGYVDLYEHDAQLARSLAEAASMCRQECASLRGRDHHTMMLAGGVAYWLSAPSASRPACKVAVRGLRAELGALLIPPMLLMRCWRAAKAARRLGRRRSSG